MRRRRAPEEPENHERWLVSYADFITLLFAFFVVMYSVSQVNEGKFRVLSDTLVAAFRDPTRSLRPVQVGKLARTPNPGLSSPGLQPSVIDLGLPDRLERADRHTRAPDAQAPPATPDPAGPGADPSAVPAPEPAPGEGAPMATLDTVADEVRDRMSTLISGGLAAVRRGDSWLEVEFKTSILFTSGSARLAPAAAPVLDDVAQILKTFPNPVQVEGFTDDVPISTPAFPSNWELSAARAASVVHLFMKSGIEPERMVAIGYGQYRPVADNATEEGRAKNRRVVLVIPAERDSRRVLDLNRLAPEAPEDVPWAGTDDAPPQ